MTAFGRITGVGVQNIDAKSGRNGRAVVRVPPNFFGNAARTIVAAAHGELLPFPEGAPALALLVGGGTGAVEAPIPYGGI